MSNREKPCASLGAARPRYIKFLSFKRFYQGFTLIELSLVLFLIGVLLFVAMPRLDNFLFQSDLKSTARSLKATVQFLRSKSIATHKHTALHFDLDHALYWGAYIPVEDAASTLLRGGGNQLVPPRKLPKGIRFLDVYNMNIEKATIGVLTSTFNPKGIMEETVVHLVDRDDNKLTIIINAFTGRFIIHEDYVDVEYK